MEEGLLGVPGGSRNYNITDISWHHRRCQAGPQPSKRVQELAAHQKTPCSTRKHSDLLLRSHSPARTSCRYSNLSWIRVFGRTWTRNGSGMADCGSPGGGLVPQTQMSEHHTRRGRRRLEEPFRRGVASTAVSRLRRSLGGVWGLRGLGRGGRRG